MVIARRKILSIILAGGRGTRLAPLTDVRSKPAVPFGGTYRLIDFPLSNLINSGFSKIIVLTQYKSHSLNKHISTNFSMSKLLGTYITPVPAQQTSGEYWYRGSADAIYQCKSIVADENPDIIVVLGADHVYRMDFAQMVESHIESGAQFTVAGIRQKRSDSKEFGIIFPKKNSKMIAEFSEKPTNPKGLSDNPDEVLASMGNYVANTQALFEALEKDQKNAKTKYDMGGDIVPYFVSKGEAGYYDFKDNLIPGDLSNRHYWRDVGTIEAFYDSHMDLNSPDPEFNLYNQVWPIYAGNSNLPPAKFVHNYEGRRGVALKSLVSPGTIISGSEILNSIIGVNSQFGSWSSVWSSIVFSDVTVMRHARINKAIIDKGVLVEEGATVGVDKAKDLKQGFTVTKSGITVVPRGCTVKAL
ncbi:MAG: glucose-1-phosphate adenylyltransferase [Bifidobacteriaceae bacterium]|jgi:glucose-1-phosphate adenylyltransferase|nr:glucose-1-phosphate adenylyltransferase [Bifidobacteriaceae bacterium]